MSIQFDALFSYDLISYGKKSKKYNQSEGQAHRDIKTSTIAKYLSNGTSMKEITTSKGAASEKKSKETEPIQVARND